MSERHDGSPAVVKKVSPADLGPMKEIGADEDRREARSLLRHKLAIWCAKVCEGVDRGERNAMNNYARAMGLIGAEVELNVHLAVQREFGVSLDDLRRVYEVHRNSSAASLEQCEADGVALLRWVISQDPSRRMTIIRAMEAEDVGLLEANGNGEHHGQNGNGSVPEV